MGEFTLYSYWRSSASWRVRIVLNFKNLDFDTVAVNLLKNQQTDESYAEINPTGLIPSLVLPDHSVLFQSVAIMEYLEEVYPEVMLLPKDPLQKAKVRTIMNMIVCDIHPVQNLRVLKYLGEDRKMEWAKHFITIGFQSIEAVIKETHGRFCVGDMVTFADICLIPQVYNANRFGVDMTLFPLISAIVQECEKLQEFYRAHPNQQVDAVQ